MVVEEGLQKQAGMQLVYICALVRVLSFLHWEKGVVSTIRKLLIKVKVS
jgi:hypothetical protein